FMTENCGKQPFRISTGKRVVISMTDTCSLDFDQYFTGRRSGKVDFFNRKWLACLPGDCCPCFHRRWSFSEFRERRLLYVTGVVVQPVQYEKNGCEGVSASFYR